MSHTDLYLEKRHASNTISDIMRHWQTRHDSSKAIIITNDPVADCKTAEKQWLRLTSLLQQKRLDTSGAHEILELTYEITHMQQVHFSTRSPDASPAAHIWFLTPDYSAGIPLSCRTIYLMQPPLNAANLLDSMHAHGVIVDYCAVYSLNHPRLQPKSALESKLHEAWQETESFLIKRSIMTAELSKPENADKVDDAIDNLLDVSSDFLRHVYHFQECLHLAEPLVLTKSQKEQYDTAIMLARRVSALKPSVFGRHLKQTFDADPFTFYDGARAHDAFNMLAQLIAYHRAAGRLRLARALEQTI